MNKFYVDDNGKSNVYIEKVPVYDLYESINNLLLENNTFVNSNIGRNEKIQNSYELSLFLNDYKNHLKDVEKTYKNKKNIEGWKITILLPKDFNYKTSKYKVDLSKRKLMTLIKSTNEYIFNGIKYQYFSFVEMRGNQQYLSIVYLARYYYYDGVYRLKYATSDWYYDTKTGRRCKCDYKTAKLKYKRGDVIGKYKIYVGSAIRVFNIPKEGFKLWINNLKLEIANKFDSVFNAKKEKIKRLFPKKSYKQTIVKNNKYFKITRNTDNQNYKDWYYIRKLQSENAVRTFFNTISVKNTDMDIYYDEIKEMMKQAYRTHKLVNDFESEMLRIIDYIKQLNSLTGSKNEAKKNKTNQVRIFNSPDSYSHIMEHQKILDYNN